MRRRSQVKRVKGELDVITHTTVGKRCAAAPGTDPAGNAAYMRSPGMVLVTPLLVMALAIEVLAPVGVIGGFWARVAAAVMAA
jgi:uncharacterized membrane protein YphA (DoxX/SURF4 family)